MIHNFKTSNGISVCFDEEAVVAFKQGKQLQHKYGDGHWNDWNANVEEVFGPWYYSPSYQWRVKPETIEFEFDREVRKVVVSKVKVKVEIPIPFKGKLEKNQDYFTVQNSEVNQKWYISNCINYNEQVGEMHVKENIVYLDKESAEKAKDILNG